MQLAALAQLVAAPNDLSLPQWERLYARAVASGADLHFEVGRGYGNSTVVLTEAAHATGARVVSVGYDEPPAFETVTWPKVQPVLGDDWRQPLTVIQGDIRDHDPPPCKRCFLFWDAHDDGVTKAVLGRIIPALPSGSLVVVHDVSRREPAHETRHDLYGWRDFVSPFPELQPLGRWLDAHGIVVEYDTGMLAFALT